MMTRRTTIKDVAQHAGVAPSTVSVVLNDVNGARVAPETRERILTSARELGYAADPTARALRTQKANTIGLVSDAIATTPYAGQMLQGAQDAAWKRGMLMLLLNTGGDPDLQQAAIDTLVQRRVDGIIFATWYHQVVPVPEVPKGLPLVLLDARPADRDVSFVVPDEQAGAAVAVAELLDHGHRRIGFLQENSDIPAAAARLIGYRDTLAAAGIAFDPALVTRDTGNAEGGRRALPRLLALDEPPTAVFCFNDRMAMGAYQAAAAHGVRVPEELSIIGFDDQPDIASGLHPGLSTVALPHYEMGAWAVETVLTDQVRELRMPCRLVRRGSVAQQ